MARASGLVSSSFSPPSRLQHQMGCSDGFVVSKTQQKNFSLSTLLVFVLFISINRRVGGILPLLPFLLSFHGVVGSGSIPKLIVAEFLRAIRP